MKIKPGYKLRKMCGSSIVVAVGKHENEFNGLITLNKSGEMLWEKLSEGADEHELVELLLSEYDIDEPTAKADVKAFINKADGANLIER